MKYTIFTHTLPEPRRGQGDTWRKREDTLYLLTENLSYSKLCKLCRDLRRFNFKLFGYDELDYKPTDKWIVEENQRGSISMYGHMLDRNNAIARRDLIGTIEINDLMTIQEVVQSIFQKKELTSVNINDILST